MRRIALILMIFLSACATFDPVAELKPGLAIQADVRATLGAPGRVYTDVNGT